MLNWKSLNLVYLYDGSFDGLLTIVFDCFKYKQFPSNIFTKDSYQTNLIDQTVYIETDFEKSKRILDGILKTISYETLFQCYHAFLAGSIRQRIAYCKIPLFRLYSRS